MLSPHVVLSLFLFAQRKYCIRKYCKTMEVRLGDPSQLQCQCSAKIRVKHPRAGFLSRVLCLDSP